MDENFELEETLENPQNPPEEETGEEESVGGESSPDIDSLKSEVEKLKKINSQLYARLKKEERKKVVEKENSGKGDSEWKEKIEFLIKRRDFDADELEIVSAFAKGLNKSLEEAVKHPAVEGALKFLREKKAAEKATLESSSRQSSGEDTSLLAKWKAGKLSEREFKQNFRKIQEEFFAKTRGTKSYE